jgi:hypothetical protein
MTFRKKFSAFVGEMAEPHGGERESAGSGRVFVKVRGGGKAGSTHIREDESG